jgi:hypothetical protein
MTAARISTVSDSTTLRVIARLGGVFADSNDRFLSNAACLLYLLLSDLTNRLLPVRADL